MVPLMYLVAIGASVALLLLPRSLAGEAYVHRSQCPNSAGGVVLDVPNGIVGFDARTIAIARHAWQRSNLDCKRGCACAAYAAALLASAVSRYRAVQATCSSISHGPLDVARLAPGNAASPLVQRKSSAGSKPWKPSSSSGSSAAMIVVCCA